MQTNITTDERKGFTSASNAESDSLCAGRHLAQRGLTDTTSADAEIGNRIHAFLAGEKVNLTADESDLAEKCSAIEQSLLNDIFGQKLGRNILMDGDAIVTRIRETRIWSDFGGFKHSGKPDVVYIYGKIGLVIDYKTGRNEVAVSSRNLQLRDLAVLVTIEHGLDKVYVAVIQPWATMKPEPCEYDKSALILALGEMEGRIISSNDPKSERTPGIKQCEYCKAKAICPEARELALTPTADAALPNNSGTPEALALALDNATLAKFIDRASFAEKVIDACRDEAKRRIAEGQEVPGYKLKDGSVRESISDAQECWKRTCSRGVTVEQFMGVVTVAKGKLKDTVKAATGLKGKALDADMALILEGITEEKQSAPSLVKI